MENFCHSCGAMFRLTCECSPCVDCEEKNSEIAALLAELERVRKENESLRLTGNEHAVNCDNGHAPIAFIRGVECPVCKLRQLAREALENQCAPQGGSHDALHYLFYDALCQIAGEGGMSETYLRADIADRYRFVGVSKVEVTNGAVKILWSMTCEDIENHAAALAEKDAEIERLHICSICEGSGELDDSQGWDVGQPNSECPYCPEKVDEMREERAALRAELAQMRQLAREALERYEINYGDESFETALRRIAGEEE